MRTITEENAADVAKWCHGKLAKEVDPEDPKILHSAVNFPSKDGVGRAHIGDMLQYNIQDDAYEIRPKACER